MGAQDGRAEGAGREVTCDILDGGGKRSRRDGRAES